MNINPDETQLIGSWIQVQNRLQGDEVCERIDHLTKTVLKKVASSPQCGAWETLFLDPFDARYWEKTYPQGELHGGGPPRLKVMSPDEAKAKYKM